MSDLESARRYIAEDNPQAAARVGLRILDAVGLLSTAPAMGRPGRIPGTRELVVTGSPSIIPHRVQANRLELLRVYHAHRRWPPQLEGNKS